MAPKRKPPNPEHANVPIGRAKIRRGQGGKKLVEETIRNNVLLFLEKLKDEEANDVPGASFQSKLSSAVAGALDPLVGPESVMDLHNYGWEELKIFGNKEAGVLMAALLNMVDDGGGKRLAEMQKDLDKKKKNLEKETADREKVEKTLAYLQTLIPLSQDGQRDLASSLEALDSDVQDAGWMYGILWNSTLQWMDTRLRQMRAYGKATKNTPPEPTSLSERSQLINIRVHGGDLRVDSLMSQIKFGDHRHGDANYDHFVQESFKKMYRMSIDDGIWLARHGNDIARGVDWPHIIGFIDKFVAMSDRVAGWKQPPANFEKVHNDRFAPLTAHVTSLIGKAKADEDWTVDEADSTTLAKLQRELYTECKTWAVKGQRLNEWDRMQFAQTFWGPAEYLKDVPTAQPRTAQGAAKMKLRPLVRVKYTP